MGKKKQQPEEQMGGAPEWITTFVDMISLLVTFFILLLTFSSMEDKVTLKLPTWLKWTDGIHERQGDVSQEPPEVDHVKATNPLEGSQDRHVRPPEELLETLDSMGQDQTDDHVPIDFSAHPDGLLVEWDASCAFAPGSGEPNAKLERSLRELSEVLVVYDLLIVVEGHTDDREAASSDAAAAGLAIARARAAAERLLANAELAPESVQIAGLGSRTPRSENDSAVGRQDNRRVAIRLLALSEVRRGQLGRIDEEGR